MEENQDDKGNDNRGREQEKSRPKEESRTRSRQDDKDKENDHHDVQKQQEGERAGGKRSRQFQMALFSANRQCILSLPGAFPLSQNAFLNPGNEQGYARHVRLAEAL